VFLSDVKFIHILLANCNGRAIGTSYRLSVRPSVCP